MRQRRLLSAALVFTLALSVPRAPTAAALGSMYLSPGAAIKVLQNYGIVDKVPDSELRLDDTISRAEMAKVLAATLKLQPPKTAIPFPDTQGHWAAGWIAVAREKGLFQGRSDGLFYPQDPVTYAEVLTVLLRMTGRGPQAAYNWPWGAISTAADFGMVPKDMDLGGRMMEPATRRNVFRLTAIAAGRMPMAGSLETLLQTMGDKTPPTLELVRIPAVTGDWRPTVNGYVGDAVSLTVAGEPIDIQPDGTFSAQIDLIAGTNHITFLATDGAGNQAERAEQVILQTIARLAFVEPLVETAVGQSFKPSIIRFDPYGEPVPTNAVMWTYDTTAFKRDVGTGTFTPTRFGDYTLRASVEGVEATAKIRVAGDPAQLELTTPYSTVVAGGGPVPVIVRVLDADGRLVTSGNHQIQFAVMPSQGATFDSPMATAVRGRAAAYLSPGWSTGGLGIQASLLGTAKIVSPTVAVNIEPRRLAGIQLSTLPPNAKAVGGQSVKVIATAVDQIGIPFAVREDTAVTLNSWDDSILKLTRTTAIIKAGTSASSASGQDGLGLTTGNSGQVRVSGFHGGMKATAAVLGVVHPEPLAALDVEIIREVALADRLSAVLVAVTRRDKFGDPAVSDTTPVVLFSPSPSANISLVQDSGGVALFAVRSGMAGRMEVVAGIPGRHQLNTTPKMVAFIQSTNQARPVIKTSARTMTPGSTATAYVALEGLTGQYVANPGPPITFNLDAPGSTLTSTQLVVQTGATRTDDTTVNIPLNSNMVTLTGQMVGGMTLNPAVISVTPLPPVPPAPVPVGNNLVAEPSLSGRSPVAGEEMRFVVKARNGLTTLNGSYAFGVGILINGQAITSPMQGLSIKAGPRFIPPNGLVRTTRGEMEIWVRYTGTGVVQLQPQPKPAATTAYDQWGVAGDAAATTGYQSFLGKAAFTPGPLHHMSVQVRPNMGDTSQGVIHAAPGRFATVRLSPVDEYDNPAGDSCLATLTQVKVTPPGALVLRASGMSVTEYSQSVGAGGYAEFNIAAMTEQEATSEWSPMIVCGTTPLVASENVTVTATVHQAPYPNIEFAGGSLLTTATGILKSTDNDLYLRIAQVAPAPETAELLVYEGSILIGRFGPVSPASADRDRRTVRLPKALFSGQNRTISLRVRIHSGSAVSEESQPVTIYYQNQ